MWRKRGQARRTSSPNDDVRVWSSNWPSGSQQRCQRAPWHRFDTQRADMKGDKCPCTPSDYRKFSSDAIHFCAILTRLSHQDTLVVSRGHIAACNADRTSLVRGGSELCSLPIDGNRASISDNPVNLRSAQTRWLDLGSRPQARVPRLRTPLSIQQVRSTQTLTIFIFSTRSAMAVAIELRSATPKCAPVRGAPIISCALPGAPLFPGNSSPSPDHGMPHLSGEPTPAQAHTPNG